MSEATVVITIKTTRADARSMTRIYAAGDWTKIIQGVTNLLGNPDNEKSLQVIDHKGCVRG